MCGIAGIFGVVGGSVEARRRGAARMSERICHRGPDDTGTCELMSGEESVGTLSHRRLSIIDPSPAGHQPMLDSSGRLSIVFNGEIYNHRALRDALAREGARFRSDSDTEVILEGWAREGERFLGRLRGMFAFALWDRREARGYLVRDRFGIKPLYVATPAGAVAFASEVRAVLEAGGMSRRLERETVAAYLAQGAIPEPLTSSAGVRPVPAGSLVEVTVRDGRATASEPRTFARALEASGAAPERDPARAAALARSALEDSVAHHLVSDVPVAFFLSGGIDSSAVVALASEASAQRLHTFTITFADKLWSEAGPASAVARRFGTDHAEVPLSADDLLAHLPGALRAMDQPSLDGLNTFAVSAAVRAAGYKVVLSGLGGDEMFAGYPAFARAARLSPLWGAGSIVRRPVGALAGLLARRGDARAAKLAAALGGPDPARAAYAASRTLFGDRMVESLLGMDGGGDGWGHGAAAPPAKLSLLQRVSWYELSGYMRNTLLRDSDVFSMAHGLELRVPFIDTAVAAATVAIDDALKLARGRSKPLLVAALGDLLPREVWDRPKQGFELPFAHWMRHELRSEVESALTSPDRLARVGVQPAAARGVWEGFLANRPGLTWSRAWALFTLVRWAEESDTWTHSSDADEVPERWEEARTAGTVDAAT